LLALGICTGMRSTNARSILLGNAAFLGICNY
jgi:hypothetical protein